MSHIKKSIVSMFDALGFSSLILEEDLEKIYGYIIGAERLTETNSIGVKSKGDIFDCTGNKVGELIGSDKINRPIEYKFAFDTMIYYTLNDDESDFYHIIVSTAKLIAYMYFFIGLPIRGAISCGEIYFDEKNIFGKALIDAHKYEMKQEWCGGVLSPQLVNRFKNTNIFKQMCSDNLLLEYDVPIKVKNDNDVMKIGSENFYTINWMQYAGKNMAEENFKKQWSILRNDDKLNNEVINKLNNTIRYRKFSLKIAIKNFKSYNYGNTICI